MLVIFTVAMIFIIILWLFAYKEKDLKFHTIKEIRNRNSEKDKILKLRHIIELVKEIISMCVIGAAVNVIPQNTDPVSWFVLVYGLCIYILASFLLFEVDLLDKKD